MISFRLGNPTEIVFGQGQIAALPELLPREEKVLLLYGGGSIKKNGVYDQVVAGLAGDAVEEFGGVEPNPVYETLLEAAELARRSGSDFILGVGGGSVSDAAKFLATIVPISGEDPWDYLVAGKAPPSILPNGAVLTLPATGSESNPVSVITHNARRLKIPFAHQAARPRFAILDPSTMKSLSRRQLANGVVDAFTHVLEQYMTLPVNAPIQYGYSEAIMDALVEWGPKLIEENSNEARENVMWAANQALNGLIGSGVPQDWSSHYIGHAITALYDVDHGRTLSMVMPSVMRHKLASKAPMLARYARRVWHVGLDDDRSAAEAGIARTEQFFARMGCPIRISDEPSIEVNRPDIVAHVERARQLPLGEFKDIGGKEILSILEAAA